ncbi:MAG TPA: hypothetical protein VGF48_01915 [Thermoanaerobaculia bacterium]
MILCKDCWIAHEAATLLARCKRCEANTEIHRLDPLPSKASNGGSFSSPLICRLHATEPLDLYCGSCRREVSPRSRIAEGGVLAILGDTEAGKTSLLWIVSERLRQPNASGVVIRGGLGDSDEQMMRAVREIFDHGRLSTTPATDADVRNYAWEVANAAGETTVLAFHDAAGEVWNDLPSLSRTSYDRFYRYLDLVGSVIFAVDGVRVAEAIETFARKGVASPQLRRAQTNELAIIDAVARRMRARKERIPAAVVITKADVLWNELTALRPDSDADAETIDRTVRELLVSAGRQQLVQALGETFDPLRFFAVSAFGRTPQQQLRVEELAPARVEEPFVALLSTIRV